MFHDELNKVKINNSLIGSQILADSLFIQSNHVVLMNVKLESDIFENAHKTEMNTIAKIVSVIAFGRVTRHSSVRYSIIISNVETTDVKAAGNKNKALKIVPLGICKKIFGRGIKTNLGPAVGSIQKVKTAGKSVKPTSKAIIVSVAEIETVVVVKFSFLLMYEAYVNKGPIPTFNEKNECPKSSKTAGMTLSS